MKKIKRRPILPITIVIIIVIRRNISAPALSAVELEDGIISMPVLDSDWSVFTLLVRKTCEFLFNSGPAIPSFLFLQNWLFRMGTLTQRKVHL